MKTFLLIFILIASMHILAGAQTNDVLVQYYYSTDDFVQNRLSTEEIILEVKSMGSDYIYSKDVKDIFTGNRYERGRQAWAIEYDGHSYMNLLYSYNAKSPNLYVQVDLKGRFCLAVMEEDFLSSMNAAQPYYGGGAAGYAAQASATDGGKFIDSEGKKRKIFIIDTKDLSIVLPYKAKNAPAENLTKSTLKWLVGKENFKGSTSDYTVEEIIAIVEDLNRRQ